MVLVAPELANPPHHGKKKSPQCECIMPSILCHCHHNFYVQGGVVGWCMGADHSGVMVLIDRLSEFTSAR
jgi:hypothetical protein